MRYRLLQSLAAVVLVVAALGTGCEQVTQSTQPLTTSVTVGLINKTPYRAIFTLGAWEPQDRESLPQFKNYAVEAQSNDDPSQGVDGLLTQTITFNSLSGVYEQTGGCRRAISIGAANLIQQINNKKDTLSKVSPPLTVTLKHAMITGVSFSDAPVGSTDEYNPTVGTAEPLTLDQGVDYPCGSVVIFTFVQDANTKGGFRIESGTIH